MRKNPGKKFYLWMGLLCFIILSALLIQLTIFPTKDRFQVFMRWTMVPILLVSGISYIIRWRKGG